MSFRDGQEQGVDVRQAQLTVALQDRRRSLMIAFACRQQLDSALARPAQYDQGSVRRSGRCDAGAKQRIGLANNLPERAQLPALSATGLDRRNGRGVVLVVLREQSNHRSGIQNDCPHALAVDHLVDFLRERWGRTLDHPSEGEDMFDLACGVR